MASTNYRLLHRICNCKVFGLPQSSSRRLIFTSNKHSIPSTVAGNSKLLSVSNQHLLFDQQFKHSFASQAASAKDEDSDFDSDDSDLSDFSDFSDSDSDDDNKQSRKQPASPSKSNAPANNKGDFTFSNEDVSDDMLMKDRLIISNLNFSTNRNDLWELCENYGTVTDVHLPANRNRDFHNRGFGFVTFESDNDAKNALDSIAGTMLNSRQLRAGYARRDTEKTAHSPQPSHAAPSGSNRKFSEFEFTSPSSPSGNVSNFVEATPELHSVQNLQETTITVNGLPGNVNLAQITKMFGEFGNITNITFSPYRMMGHSFMNAIVSVNLKRAAVGNAGAQPVSAQHGSNEAESETLSFQNEREIKDRSVERNDLRTQRRNMPMSDQRAAPPKKPAIDPAVLAKEIDELLADTDEEEDSDEEQEDKIEVLDELDSDGSSDDDDFTTSSSEEEEDEDDDDSDDEEEKAKPKKRGRPPKSP